MQKLCQALRANATLKELYASGHHLTPQTAGMLGAMLAANTSLVSICLGDDALGDAVSVHPCERSFKFNFFLSSDQKLNNDAHVSKEGMIAIVKVHYLLCCTKCAWLLLQGIRELVDGIKQNSTLQKVDLENKVHIVTLLPLTICA